MPLILGIDPGLQHTGWGVIRMEGNNLSFVACGVISPPAKLPLSERLKLLHEGLVAAVELHHPHEIAVEETFVNMNGASTLKLGQARGAILLSLSLTGLQVHEYAATLVKKTVVGAGRAEKTQISMMVQTLLPGCAKAGADAMDALAVAICHANHSNMGRIIARESYAAS